MSKLDIIQKILLETLGKTKEKMNYYVNEYNHRDNHHHYHLGWGPLEANLVHHFGSILCELSENGRSILIFEAPYINDNQTETKGRIDCLVMDRVKKIIYRIECKQLSNTKHAKSLLVDFELLPGFRLNTTLINNIRDYTEVDVILAETDSPTINSWWFNNEDCPNGMSAEVWRDLNLISKNWNSINSINYEFNRGPEKTLKTKYLLLKFLIN